MFTTKYMGEADLTFLDIPGVEVKEKTIDLTLKATGKHVNDVMTGTIKVKVKAEFTLEGMVTNAVGAAFSDVNQSANNPPPPPPETNSPKGCNLIESWKEPGKDYLYMAMTHEGHLVFSSPLKLKNIVKYDQNGNLLATFPDFTEPCNLITNKDGDIIVGDGRGLKVLDKDGNLKQEITKYVYVVAAMYARDDGTLLLVNGGLQLWNLQEGKLLKKFIGTNLMGEQDENPGKGKLAGSPAAITVNSKGEIILVDSNHGSHKVLILDSQFNFLREFGKLGEADEDISYCDAVAVDSQDRIYLTDHTRNSNVYRVKIFTPEGKHLHTFAHGEYSNCMTVCKQTGKIFVWRGHVEVYSPFQG